MAILLIGIVCFWVASRALAREHHWAPRPVVWTGVIAVIALAEIWTARADLARYRFSMVGLRYGAEASSEQPSFAIRVGGGDDADLDLRAAGAHDALHIDAALGVDRVVESVTASVADDATAVAIVERRDRLRRRHRTVLGGVPVGTNDTLRIRNADLNSGWVIEQVPDTLVVMGLHLPLPWTARHRIRDLDSGRTTTLPLSELGWGRRVTGRRPTVFARTFPLADLTRELVGVGDARLTSFLYYDGPELWLADLDSEVSVSGSGEVETVAESLWSDGQGTRLLLAALPLRDYPELKLTLPERYGVRAVVAYDVTASGGFVDLMYAEPEIRAVDRAQLDAIRLPNMAGGDDVLRVRISHTANSLARRAVVFDSPPLAFATGTQAILALSTNPAHNEFEVLTPAGATRWPTATPLPLGSDSRATLLRVDGQGASLGFWLLHLALFGLVIGLFAVRQPAGITYALAIAAVGLAATRLLLGISAHVGPPFVGEAMQLSLWLLPVLPWAVIAAADAVRPPTGTRGPVLHAAFAGIVVVLTLGLFDGSIVRQLVLSAVPLALGAAVVLRTWKRPASTATNEQSADRTDDPRALPQDEAASARSWRRWAARATRHGWVMGLVLVTVRVVFDLLGWREGLSIGGTRIALSLVYTPLTLVALAWVLAGWLRDIRVASGGEVQAVFARGLLDVGAFCVLGYVAVGFAISDFGIPLAIGPGALFALALVGLGLGTRAGLGNSATLVLAVPLLLFIAVQAAPRMLEPAWSGTATEPGRLSEWNRNELLLLERGDPQALLLIGQRRSEALAVMRETMRSYTRGNWFGNGFLRGRVSPAIEETATREHTASALLASQWGLAGSVGLILLLCSLFGPATRGELAPPNGSLDPKSARGVVLPALAILAGFVLVGRVMPAPYGAVLVVLAAAALVVPWFAPSARIAGRNRPRSVLLPASVGASESAARFRDSALDARRRPAWADLAGSLFLLTFAGAGLYMVLANYGLVFFTGKNVYLLGLDSVGDALEALVLLAGGAALLAIAHPPESDPTETREPEQSLEPAARPQLSGAVQS